jgi:hypothetical protein
MRVEAAMETVTAAPLAGFTVSELLPTLVTVPSTRVGAVAAACMGLKPTGRAAPGSGAPQRTRKAAATATVPDLRFNIFASRNQFSETFNQSL